MAADRETLTYEDFGQAARELALQVADDVADTGKTLELVREFCAGHVADVRSAVVLRQ
jgi:hypoxanthine phosphoribosyltransferase